MVPQREIGTFQAPKTRHTPNIWAIKLYAAIDRCKRIS